MGLHSAATGHAVSVAAGGMSVSVFSRGSAAGASLSLRMGRVLKGFHSKKSKSLAAVCAKRDSYTQELYLNLFVRCTGRYCIVNGP